MIELWLCDLKLDLYLYSKLGLCSFYLNTIFSGGRILKKYTIFRRHLWVCTTKSFGSRRIFFFWIILKPWHWVVVSACFKRIEAAALAAPAKYQNPLLACHAPADSAIPGVNFFLMLSLALNGSYENDLSKNFHSRDSLIICITSNLIIVIF